MRFVDEFRDPALARDLADALRRETPRSMRLMEVCGTHTMAIARFGIKAALPEGVRLISGPGCPVCVTPQSLIDAFIELGRRPDMTLTTFGDMLRVPGTDTNLEVERARGADVRIVYSPLDAVALAAENPSRKVVFFGVGFETTAPAVALSVLEAQRLGLDNFFVLAALKTIPPALAALASNPDVALDGFLCPGHVSTILGSAAYEPLAADHKIPCVIAGFEPLDILQALLMLMRQVADGRAEVEVQYSRAVSREGMPVARRCIDTVFAPVDAAWRGLGVLPASGLGFRPEFAAFDAAQCLPEMPAEPPPPSVCECAAILLGLKSPAECLAFGTACTPERPLGPCMVSSEGACAAEFRYASGGSRMEGDR